MVKNTMFREDEKPYRCGIDSVGHGRIVSEAKWIGAIGDARIVMLQTLPKGAFPGSSVPNGRRIRS